MTACVKTDDDPQRNENHKYSISVLGEKTALEDDSSETRVELVDGVPHWSADDTIGLYVFKKGFNYIMSNLAGFTGTIEDLNSYVVASNIPLTGRHEEPVRNAHFSGELTFEQISRLYPDSLYEYMSYYPYMREISKGVYEVWTINYLPYFLSHSHESWVESNVFPAHLTRLISNEFDGLPPLAWLDERGVQRSGERLSFNYMHYQSYLRLTIVSNEINTLRVNSVSLDIPNRSGWIERVEIDPETGSLHADISNIHTSYIEGGMSVGDYIYIPIDDGDYTDDRYPMMTVEFTFEDGTTWSKTLRGGVAEQGKVHNIGFNIR